jgi:hypothetical protein
MQSFLARPVGVFILTDGTYGIRIDTPDGHPSAPINIRFTAEHTDALRQMITHAQQIQKARTENVN